jgi:exodeoxyribonuclease VII small subunit
MAKSKQASINTDELPDFESSLKELEELVEKLENDELSLQDSLKQFERGISLSRHCHTMLESARQTVSVLTDPDNPDSERPFLDQPDEQD